MQTVERKSDPADAKAPAVGVRPPLKWAGGKRWQVPYLLPLWTAHGGSRLVEPFCGGLAVALGLLPDRALLNDIKPVEPAAEERVFTTMAGTALDDANLRRWFKTVLERAELPKETRLHDLRHTCASLLAHAGVSAENARATLGHSDVRLTMQVYTHVLDDGKRVVANALDKAVGR